MVILPFFEIIATLLVYRKFAENAMFSSFSESDYMALRKFAPKRL